MLRQAWQDDASSLGARDHDSLLRQRLEDLSGPGPETGKRFHRLIVRRMRFDYGLKSRYRRLRARGLLTIPEMAKLLRVCKTTIKLWRRAGLLTAYRYDDKNQYLFERPGAEAPIKNQRQEKTKRLKNARILS